MPIDVQMPDGTIISGVPDNISQADLLARYKAYTPPEPTGKPVPDELGRYDVAKQPTTQPSNVTREAPNQFMQGVADVGKLFTGEAVRGITGAPEAVEQAATVPARETATAPSEALNLIADPRQLTNKIATGLGFSPVFDIEKPTGIVPNELIKRQSAALDETFTKGKIPALTALTNYGNKVSKEIQDSVSPEMKEAMASTEVTGNLVKALGTGDFSDISFGKDPSAQGLIGQAAKVFGSTGTSLALGLLTKSPTVGGAVGFGMAGSEGVDTAKEHIQKMSDQDLNKNSEYFRNLLVLGYDKKTAREMTIDKAASTASMTQGLVGALGSEFTTKLVSGQLDKKLIDAARSKLGSIVENRAARIAGGTAVGMTEEGIQELAEGIATDLGIDRTVPREIGVDSFANLVLGAIGGGGPGAVSGARAKTEEPKPGEPPKPAVTPAPVEPQPAPVEAAPAAVAPVPPSVPAEPAGGQDIQSMIDELRGIPKAPPAEPVEAQPVQQPAQVEPTPEVKTTAAPTEPIPGLWKGIQNRDRSTPASVAQMAKIANNPDYTRVSLSRDFGTGAPVVAGKETQPERLGRKDVITGADGKKIPIQYAVLSTSEVLASHKADGSKDPMYTDENLPPFFRAITNGRVAGLTAAYQQGTAEDYKKSLIEDDLHGIDPKVIAGIENPILVRIMPMDQVTKNIGDVSNTGAGLTFNAVEQAKNDTNRLDLSTVQFNDNGEVSPQTVRDFIKAMPDTERGNLIDKEGNPTKQAVERVDAAIFQQAYNNDKLTELAFQAQDEEARNIVRALNMAASKAIQLKEAGDYDVRSIINEAVELAINARRNNLSLQDAAKQVDITANPLTADVLQMFADNPRSAKAIGENLSNLFTNAYQEGAKSGEDMFGAIPKRPVDQLIKDTFAKKVEPDLFAGEVTEQPEPKEFQSKKSMEQIAKDVGVMEKGSELAQYLVDEAPNSAAKAIAERVLFNIKAIEDSGVPVKIEVLTGPKRKGWYGSSQAVSAHRKIGYYKVEFNGLNSQGVAEVVAGSKGDREGLKVSKTPTGTRYSTLMHELLHVISQVQIDALMKRNYKGADKVIYKDLRSVYNALKAQVEDDKKNLPANKWHPLLNQVGTYNDKGVLKDIHELLVRSLTEADVQDYLSKIKVGKKTALTKLMEVFRKLIGLNPEYQTALDKVLTVSERIFEQTPQDIKRLAQTEGYDFPTMKEEGPDYEGEARNYKGKPVKATWDLPEDTTNRVLAPFDQTIEGLIYKIQDKQIDTKDAQKAIEKAAGKIADEQDVYEQEQLYHGRTATGIREFLLDELMPAIKELQKLNLTPQEVKDYLHNRHAEERNNKMNEVNKLDPVTGEERETPWELQDRASGISTKDAREYLAKLDPQKKAALEKVAQRFDNMVKDTQKILVDSGAESADTVEAWNNTYEHYVPLFRIEDDFNKVSGGMGATGASKGLGTRGGFSKRAMGSEKEVQDILGNLIAQRERALIRAEKIKVGKALYGLALLNPNPDLWLPVNPDAIKSKEALMKELEGLGFEDAEAIANNLMEEPKSRYISKEKKQIIDPVTGLPMMMNQEAVKLKIDNLKRFGDNVFPIRIDGKDRYIFFNKNNPRAVRMVHSLLNLDVDNLGFVTSNIAKLTRWFASVNTQYNPIFGAVNLIRDVGGANFNLTSTAIAGEQAKVTKGVIPAMRGILNVLRDERKGKTDTTGKWAKAFQEFRKEGGQTGYRDSLIRTEEEKQVIERELNKMKSGNAKKAFTAVMGALSDFNDMMENSVRVSAYVAARDKGLSPQKAAILAKNLTVNFDKKGQLSAAINAYYAFFNASVQGTARLAHTLKGPKGKAIMAGGIALGTMQAVLLAAAGYGDDEPPEFVKERNFIVPMPGGKYITIPYPLGLHILPNVGRISTELVLQGGKKAGQKIANLTGAFADAFSPVGSSGLSLQSALPTVLDPFAALEANKDAFGRPIYKKDQATNPTPGYLRSRESSSAISKTIAYYLNLASGGTKYSKGFISPTADEIDYVAGQITGGVGREALKLEQSIKGAVTGEEVPAYRIPLAGRFYGETASPAAESQRFYNNIVKMAEHESEIKGRIKNKEPVAPYMKEHPEARLWQMANTTENQINALNKQKKDFIERGLPKDRIKRIENQKTTIMKRFNDHLAKFED